MSIIEDGPHPHIRMAWLAIVGAFSVNGVAELHSDLLKKGLLKDFYALWPQKFNNKTNGVTQRRWLAMCNPRLNELISSKLGSGWVTDLTQLKRLVPLAKDAGFRAAWREVKIANKRRLAEVIRHECGVDFPLDSLFDVQVKRIHEYKRQLLNALHVVHLYDRIKRGDTKSWTNRCVLFGGKAAPGYAIAKLIIKFINNIADVVNNDPDVGERLRVAYVPDYRVSLMEKICPATELSEQISTAGKEASGTGNMKFMMNGALTIGTRDGATIEMAEEAGEENFFLFGLTADQVAGSRGSYNPHWHYDNEPETRAALDLIFSNHFSRNEPGVFEPLREALLTHGDYYMHLADLKSYLEADGRLCQLYADSVGWARKAILNIAGSGKFSSDRTIAEYAKEIWNVKPCPVE
jgi:starch phosphorylase